MSNFKLSALLISLLLLLSACEGNNEEETKTEGVNIEGIDVIMRIQEGNTWTHLSYNHLYRTTDTLTTTIGQYKTIEGFSGYDTGSGLIKNDDDGNVIQTCAYSNEYIIFPNALLYKMNIVKGESYEYNMAVFGYKGHGEEVMVDIKENPVTKTCIKADTTISTDVGNFICDILEYSPDEGVNIYKEYISINVGVIMTERFEYGSLFTTKKLIGYNIR